MKLSEISENVQLSKRAIKFYEEQGLLQVERDENGYRRYREQDILILKEISAYRKLGIPISDIKKLLKKKDAALLENILRKKEQELSLHEQEIAALREFLQTQNTEKLFQSIDYESIALALQDAVPGFTGYYFLHHFLPYLQMPIKTSKQREAYHTIVRYWDQNELKLPFMMKIIGWLLYRFCPKESMEYLVEKTDAVIQQYLHPSDEEYEKLKKMVEINTRKKNRFFYKYSIRECTKRKLMRELKDKGYYDILLPEMMILSPKYKKYQEALHYLNTRICKELGLYYDSKFNLIQKPNIRVEKSS